MQARGIRPRRYLIALLMTVCMSVGELCPLYSVSAGEPDRKSPIMLEKDKERTVYSIGPGDRETIKEDTDNAWGMLRGVLIDSRGSSGKRPDHNR